MMTSILQCLPSDHASALLLGRAALSEGPTPVLARDGRLYDVSHFAPTTAEALSRYEELAAATGRDLGALEELRVATAWDPPDPEALTLLAPVDLQCVKGAGVTFAVSAIERVIEERAGGDAGRAHAIRETLMERVGGDLARVRPGSEEAARLKAALISEDIWSQYLEVAIGPHAEVFTKAPILASVGYGAHVGVRSDSHWNNPEPEVALAVDPEGRPVGTTLANDVNLRDFEGRSALLLGKAKDNNASCALGPFIRLFDGDFGLDDVRSATVSLRVEGPEGFVLEGQSSMSLISRDPLDLVRQTLNEQHQYPDGLVLMLGTMFAPVDDRDAPGRGFTHKVGDRVRVQTDRIGALENLVTTCDLASPWKFGVSALMRNLAERGLLGRDL